ncbi:conserved phage C-terminal domain-containing protein [Staphylococcus aureus]|uniref:replication protein n=1 Tax=Staphylococcus aureus TaxID=1280 RepID=UPI0015F5BFC2|nr:replication protein [Staphylococcus aureus]MBA8659965.1 replication protein [Staphylococcus aureus]WRM83806.1 replication protein [Staphylococcus aureus]
MNKLLIDDYPIQVLPKLAELIGLNEAIILQQMHYWIGNSKHEYDNKKWIYNSYSKWIEQFPFWSESTIKRAITSLEKQNLLHVGNYNKAGFDRTKWYSINYFELEILVTRASGQNDPTNTRDYTETSSETTTNNSATDVTHEQFEEWWKLYDKKKDKKMSFTKFKSCLKKHSFEQIMQGTREYLKTITDKQYQKYPKTFLTNESYMNDYSEEIKETGIDQLERMKYDESYWD